MLYQLAARFPEGNLQAASINPELCEAARFKRQPLQTFHTEDEKLKITNLSPLREQQEKNIQPINKRNTLSVPTWHTMDY